jgi:hypothetical protein
MKMTRVRFLIYFTNFETPSLKVNISKEYKTRKFLRLNNEPVQISESRKEAGY